MQTSRDDSIIRLLSPGDEEGYFALIDQNRSRLEDFFAGTVVKNKTFEDTCDFVAEVSEKARNRQYFPYVIVDKPTGKLIGFIDIKSIDWNIPKAELGYFIDQAYEGKGIISSALASVIDHCFRELKFIKLLVRTHRSNTASIRVAEKNGFEVEGFVRRDYKTTKGEVVDIVYYGLVNPEE